MFTSPEGYVGLSKIEDGKVNICGLFKNRRNDGVNGTSLLLAFLRRASLNALADRLEEADLDGSSFCGAAGFQPGAQKGPVFRIGDAAAMIPPFTGNGMSMAFESAECGLQPALDYASGRTSWTEAGAAASAGQSSRFRRRMTAAGLLHRFLMNPAGLKLIGALARGGCLPLQPILHLVR
jgi:2-polyprenyl-6-methoxyphenol hydroxylase-like FAD-dependent oxidoreductase